MVKTTQIREADSLIAQVNMIRGPKVMHGRAEIFSGKLDLQDHRRVRGDTRGPSASRSRRR